MKNTFASQVFLLFVFVLMSSFCYAQSPGTLDTSFNILNETISASPGVNWSGEVRAVVLQPDGKVLLGGGFDSYNRSAAGGIVRTNTDGSIDTSFNSGTGAFGVVNSVLLQPDGKIIIAGNFSEYNGISCNRIARLNNDGSFDYTFSTGVGANAEIVTMATQPDGKIIIGGAFTTYNNLPANYIARLNTDGGLDTAFAQQLQFNSNVNALAIQSDGKILTGGWFTNVNETSHSRFVRLNTDGSLDTGFSEGLEFGGGYIKCIAILPNDKIIITGSLFEMYYANSGVGHSVIARFNADGSLDTSFVLNEDIGHSINKVKLYPDGRMVLGGDFFDLHHNFNHRLTIINPDGYEDASFTTTVGPSDSVYDLDIQPDGKLVVVGKFKGFDDVSRSGVVRLTAFGDIDLTYNPAVGSDFSVSAVVPQPDGKIILGGAFFTYNGTPQRRIVRLNDDGGIDATFNSGTGTDYGVVSVALQSDNKIIIGGGFSEYNGVARKSVARLNENGSLDTAFNPGMGANNTINTVVVQPDGKILLGGIFTTFNGEVVNRIVRLKADGTIDSTFNTGTGANRTVRAIALQPDGKIIIGGLFTTYNGVIRNHIARLNTDGSLDQSFNPLTGTNGNIYAVALQPDGKIVVGGLFTDVNGVYSRCIARLNQDGATDATFNIGSGATGDYPYVYSIVLQNDNKIIVGGGFNYFNGLEYQRIVRLNIDGSTDVTFSPARGFSTGNIINSVAMQPDGKILIGGSFISYNGVYRDNIARIYGQVCNTPVPQGESVQNVTAPTADEATIEDLQADGTGVRWYDADGNLIEAGTVLVNGATYYATQTINECESAALAVTVEVVLGTDNTATIDFKYYPNPVAENITITYKSNIEEVEVYTLIGQKVLVARYSGTAVSLDMSKLQQATYMVKVKSAEHSKTFLVVKN